MKLVAETMSSQKPPKRVAPAKATSFDDLPQHILGFIVPHASLRDAAAIAVTSKRLESSVRRCEELWRCAALTQYPIIANVRAKMTNKPSYRSLVKQQHALRQPPVVAGADFGQLLFTFTLEHRGVVVRHTVNSVADNTGMVQPTDWRYACEGNYMRFVLPASVGRLLREMEVRCDTAGSSLIDDTPSLNLLLCCKTTGKMVGERLRRIKPDRWDNHGICNEDKDSTCRWQGFVYYKGSHSSDEEAEQKYIYWDLVAPYKCAKVKMTDAGGHACVFCGDEDSSSGFGRMLSRKEDESVLVCDDCYGSDDATVHEILDEGWSFDVNGRTTCPYSEERAGLTSDACRAWILDKAGKWC